ncbi:MAG: DNA mismatch repair protein MutS [Bacteroidota bacterium]
MAKTKNTKPKQTPLMRQYFEVKAKYPDAILLFRVGDFYETFGEDAKTAAGVLGITLTARNNGGDKTPLAGVPFHALDTYLPRLVRAGFRVAICEQLEKPSKEKKLVKRGVTEVVTPGVATDDKLLDHKSNNYLAAVHFGRKHHFGLSLLDVSTGEFLVCEGSKAYIDKLLQSFQPSEILFTRGRENEFRAAFGHKFYTYPLEDWVFMPDFTRERLLDHFNVPSLKGFGVEEMTDAQIAAGAILYYLGTTENKNLKHISGISRIEPDQYVWLDRFTIRNLELLYSPHENGVPLIQVLDQTVSPMGSRLLKKWVVLPLKHKPAIDSRLQIVEYFIQTNDTADFLDQQLRQIGDLERLISKVPLGKVNPREIVQLKRALLALEPIKTHLEGLDHTGLATIGEQINLCLTIRKEIEHCLNDDPPALLNKGQVIRDGFHAELDEYRNLINNSKDILVQIQKEEAEKTGITNLKIGFNNVFGYYLEVTNKYKNQGLVPENWVRKQTLTGSERYITDELKQLEAKILGAEEKAFALEQDLFVELIEKLNQYIEPIQLNAKLVGRLDCLLSFAKVARKQEYCKPLIDDSFDIEIKAGRHPVIEQQLAIDNPYVPNDTYLSNSDQQIMMITGPNMSGKSAVLRQTALIVLMAQMGSFVPAESARIGLIDKVFTRVGASDNISSGESTFMVEMNETASILNNISNRSLILLDEIGRGTSTYDGISIAWAIAEYLHNQAQAQPKTLFATHYHELNELANTFQRIKNFNIATREVDNKVLFLRKLVEGGSKHSFGIHVASMAGMPKEVVFRAAEILKELEKKRVNNQEMDETLRNLPQQPYQLNIFEAGDPKMAELKTLVEQMDINSMTPIECMLKLREIMDLMQ